MPRPVAPGLDAASLLRVIPVGQHCRVEDVAITLYSVELYEHEFVAVLRIDWLGLAAGCFPGPLMNAVDDRGGVYTGFSGGGSGGGLEPDHPSWRTWQIFCPGVAADATRLTFEVSEFQETSFQPDPKRPGTATRRVERVVAGPWCFDVPL